MERALAKPSTSSRDAETAAAGLGRLTALFFARVAGQLLVAIAKPRWLPPMEQWQSGLLPYPVLLGAQIAILAFQLRINRAVAADRAPRNRNRGRRLALFGAAYFAAMLLRYPFVRILHPGLRWFDGTIPIVFHLLLATYVLRVASLHLRSCEAPQRAPGARGAFSCW